MPEEADDVPFQIDHALAKSHGGKAVLENLVLSCFFCNNRKGPNLSGIDPDTGSVVRLFNPRRDRWQRHFRWQGPILVGRTRSGRATIAVLDINAGLRVTLREFLILEGRFPPF